jgi:hypothetical protein
MLRRETVAHPSAGIVVPVVRVQVRSVALQTPPPCLVRRPEDLVPLRLRSLGVGFPKDFQLIIDHVDPPDLRHPQFVEGPALSITGSDVLKQLLGSRHGLLLMASLLLRTLLAWSWVPRKMIRRIATGVIG